MLITLFPSGLNIRFLNNFTNVRRRFRIDLKTAISILVGFSLVFGAIYAYRRIAREVVDGLIQSLTDFE